MAPRELHAAPAPPPPPVFAVPDCPAEAPSTAVSESPGANL